MRIMENKQIIINGNLVSYVTAGTGEQSLVFLHGWRSSKEAWLPVADRMEGCGYRLFFIDLPGFGASETQKIPYSLHDYAETARQFAEKLGLKIHAVIGHSFGARIAVKLFSESPATANKLVLVASGGAEPRFGAIKKLLAALLKPLFMPRFMAPLRKKLYGLIGAEDYLATPELQKTFVSVISENLDPLMQKIQAETLIVWGDKDTTAPPAYGAHMARLIPHTRLEIMEGAGHYCFSEEPEKFTSLILKFLGH